MVRVGVGVDVKVAVGGVKLTKGVCEGVTVRVGVIVGPPGVCVCEGVAEAVGVAVGIELDVNRLIASTSLADKPHVLPSKYNAVE